MIKFTTYDDDKIKQFIECWELCPSTRILNPFNAYEAAVHELAMRGYEIDGDKLVFFEKHQDATLEHFNEYIAELHALYEIFNPML